MMIYYGIILHWKVLFESFAYWKTGKRDVKLLIEFVPEKYQQDYFYFLEIGGIEAYHSIQQIEKEFMDKTGLIVKFLGEPGNVFVGVHKYVGNYLYYNSSPNFIPISKIDKTNLNPFIEDWILTIENQLFAGLELIDLLNYLPNIYSGKGSRYHTSNYYNIDSKIINNKKKVE